MTNLPASNRDGDKMKFKQKLFAGLLIATVTMAGVYAIAATTATSMAADFSTVESTGHTSRVDFEIARQRASSEHRAARAKCELVTTAKKTACNAKAKEGEERAKAEARENYERGVRARSSTRLITS